MPPDKGRGPVGSSSKSKWTMKARDAAQKVIRIINLKKTTSWSSTCWLDMSVYEYYQQHVQNAHLLVENASPDEQKDTQELLERKEKDFSPLWKEIRRLDALFDVVFHMYDDNNRNLHAHMREGTLEKNKINDQIAALAPPYNQRIRDFLVEELKFKKSKKLDLSKPHKVAMTKTMEMLENMPRVQLEFKKVTDTLDGENYGADAVKTFAEFMDDFRFDWIFIQMPARDAAQLLEAEKEVDQLKLVIQGLKAEKAAHTCS